MLSSIYSRFPQRENVAKHTKQYLEYRKKKSDAFVARDVMIIVNMIALSEVK